jgi:hypothetical protein
LPQGSSELLEAIEEGVTRVSVHAEAIPGGEARGLIRRLPANPCPQRRVGRPVGTVGAMQHPSVLEALRPDAGVFDNC